MHVLCLKKSLYSILLCALFISCAATRMYTEQDISNVSYEEKSAQFKKIRVTFTDNTLYERRNVTVRYNADYFRILNNSGSILNEFGYDDFQYVEFSNSHQGMEYIVGGGIVGLLIPAFISEGSWSMGTGVSKGGVSLGSSARKVTLSLAGCAVGAFIGYQVGSRLFRDWREF